MGSGGVWHWLVLGGGEWSGLAKCEGSALEQEMLYSHAQRQKNVFTNVRNGKQVSLARAEEPRRGEQTGG